MTHQVKDELKLGALSQINLVDPSHTARLLPLYGQRRHAKPADARAEGKRVPGRQDCERLARARPLLCANVAISIALLPPRRNVKQE